MISIIINTCCLEGAQYQLSNAKQPHKQRVYALRNFILPQYIADSYINEVIVVGSFEEGEGFTYVNSPSKYFSWEDCLEQRQLGFEASSGDVLIFQHDDHLLQTYNNRMQPLKDDMMDCCGVKEWNVLSPTRYTRLRNVNGERLNNGEPAPHYPEGYISGHCAIYRREVIEACPWKDVPHLYTMDVEHTRQIREAGFKVVHTDAIKIWDVEFGAEPWQ